MERAVRLCGHGGELIGRALDVHGRAGLCHGQQTAVVGRGVLIDGVVSGAGHAVHPHKAAVGQQAQNGDDDDDADNGDDGFLHAHTPFSVSVTGCAAFGKYPLRIPLYKTQCLAYTILHWVGSTMRRPTRESEKREKKRKMNLSTVFAKMAMLVLIMLLGYLCARIGITGPEFNQRVTPLMVKVLLPATILNSVLSVPDFSGRELLDYILVMTVMVALQMLPAWFLPRLMRTRSEDVGATRLVTAFGNVGFVGLPVVAAIFGDEMVFFASLCNIPFNLALYSCSAAQLSPDGGRVRWQDVLNAPVIATLLSVVLLLSRVHVPGVLADTISSVSGVTIPLSMLVIGTSLGGISVRSVLTDWRVYVVSAVRLLVCPLLTWLVLRPFAAGALLGISVLMAACPSAMLVTALCLQYGRSDAFASKCIFLSTILSAVTIPLLIWLLF